LLGIRAENSTMGDMLRTVQGATAGLGRYVDHLPGRSSANSAAGFVNA